MSDAHRDDIAKLEALYAEHPEGRIFTHLAEAYRKAGELDRAQEILADGIERHPNYSSAHVVLGRVHMDQDRVEEAEAEFRRVLELDAHNLIAIRALGDLARSRGDQDRALDFYQRLLDQEPSDDEVREIVASLTGGDREELDFETTPGAEVPAGLETGSGLEPEDPEPEEPEEPEPWAEDEPAPWAAELTAEDEPQAESQIESEAPGELEGESEEWAPFQMAEGGGPAEREEASQADDMDALEPDRAEPVDAAEHAGQAEETDEVDPVEAGWERDEADPWAEADASLEPDASEVADSSAAAGEAEPAAAGGGSGPDDTELRTETIAQVYARQGLYDRAAEVYRQLARSRPDNEGLRERLAEMEELAAAQSASAGEVPPLEGLESAEVESSSAEGEMLEGLTVNEADPATGLRADAAPDSASPDEAVAEDMAVSDVPEPPEEMPWEDESVWTGEDWAAADEEAATPHAWTEDDDEPDASPPIRDYFSGLLDWSGAVVAGGAASESAGASEPASESAVAPEGAGAMEPDAGTSSSEDDDDDLEMFRSWLESLKQ